MNCFQIIKFVLDEAYNQIEGNESEKDESISEALVYLRDQYSKLLTGVTIDYSHPITRFAYIYAYVTSHANLVNTIIDKSSDLSVLFDKEKVTVTCLGGGPGSDFLGILKYLMLNSKNPRVSFKICDKEKAWLDSWEGVDNMVDPKFRISTSYNSIDVTEPEDWQSLKNYFQSSDLFTMIYFMSEVQALRDKADEFFANLFEKAKSGALFLFVDNNIPEFYDWFDELADEFGVEILKSRRENILAPIHEEKKDLGEYYKKFGSPKIRANVAYRIARKT
ncbi:MULTISPECIES: hypothetical protein [Pseudanabaena]|uniref:Uncharacterized protein n=2 Tax=Pseudanabaena TaxID=1152 RepID=L8MY63_9CYAN|nr:MULTISPECIES: hypothetical protein [Pseudanabaena]ELS32416.1 hypothetical protein Pse7429DRAFT_2568 [Pseudanabaena biceps PCC 7429]MDG3495339.1 hypothetical protein [Pseudanabaena catenata USMAC16]